MCNAHAASYTWDGNDVDIGADGGNGIWGGSTLNWWDGATNVAWPSAGLDNDVVFANAAGTVSVDAAGVVVNDITFNTTDYIIQSGGGALTLNGTTPTITTASGVTSTINSAIGGTAGLKKAGAGTLVLGGTNTFSGGVGLSGGVLEISSPSNLPSGNTLTFTNGAALHAKQASGGINISNAVVIASGESGVVKSFGQSSGNTVTLSGDYSGVSGTLILDVSGSNGYGGIGINATNGLASGSVVSVLGATNANNVQLALNTTNAQTFFANAKVSITATGAGTTFLQGGNAGTKNIQFGALEGGNANTKIAFDNTSGSTVTINGTVSAVYSGTIQNGGSASSVNFIKNGTSTQTLTGGNSYTGTTTVRNGTLQLAGGDNRLSGSASMVIGNTGTSGRLLLGSTGLSGVTDARSNLTVASLSSTGLGGSIVGGHSSLSTLTVNQSATTTFAGALGGVGTNENNLALIKSGVGILTLSGNNSYAGTTTVSGGTLRVNGINSGTGSFQVDTGATLGGTGSFAGALNVTGTLAPGASIESLGSGAVNFNNGSTFAYELDSASLNGDLLDSSGSLTLTGTVTLTLTELASGVLAQGSKLTLIDYAGAWNGGVFTYLGNALADDSVITLGGNQWQFNYNDTIGGTNFTADQTGSTGYVTMTVVPEPSVALLGGLGALALLRRRRNG